MKTNIPPILIGAIVVIALLSSCDSNGGCPEGSVPLYDAQNNVTDCFNPNSYDL